MRNFFLIVISLFLFIMLSALNTKNAYALPEMDGKYPLCLLTQCTDQKPYDFCNNGPSNTDSGGCGTPCTVGNSWTRYNVECRNVSQGPLEECRWVWVTAGAVCSTGDKYNLSDPPVMNAGACDTDQAGACRVGGPYKTCCNGASLANARNFPVDIYAPDEADCGGASTVYCGGGGQPSCGQAACNTLAPSPPPVPKYRCEGASCIRDDNGPYASSDCNNACSGGGGGKCTEGDKRYDCSPAYADSCNPDACVGLPQTCQGGEWVTTNPFGECTTQCNNCNRGGGGCNYNGVWDNGEAGVDCGGGGCPNCQGGNNQAGIYCSATSTTQGIPSTISITQNPPNGGDTLCFDNPSYASVYDQAGNYVGDCAAGCYDNGRADRPDLWSPPYCSRSDAFGPGKNTQGCTITPANTGNYTAKVYYSGRSDPDCSASQAWGSCTFSVSSPPPSCSGWNMYNEPKPGDNPTFTVGNTYHLWGWSTFCNGPNNTNRDRVDLHVCDQGTYNNCHYIGTGIPQTRQDVVDAEWTCGNDNPNADGWYFDWAPDISFAGNKTIRSASINDPGTTCVVWDASDVTIVAPTPSPSPVPIPGLPSVTVSPGLSCVGGPYQDKQVTISWDNPKGYPVTYVDISEDPGFGSYYNKGVTGLSQTFAPEGFNGGVSGQLVAQPFRKYYARLYNGQHSIVSEAASFSLPLCAPTPNAPVCSNYGKQVTLSWEMPPWNGTSGVDHYYLRLPPIIPGGNIPLITSYTEYISPGTEYAWGVKACTQDNQCSGENPAPNFTCPKGNTPWIQVTGDVHSNTGIDAPGGP